MTQMRLADEKCSDRWIDGRATLTIEASRTTISWATQMTTSARPRWRWGGGAGAAWSSAIGAAGVEGAVGWEWVMSAPRHWAGRWWRFGALCGTICIGDTMAQLVPEVERIEDNEAPAQFGAGRGQL